jgi:transcription factor IIIB subunit 2
MRCNICGDTSVEYDSYRGATVCTKCGEVLEEGRVVTELSFSQSGDGRASISGQRVVGYSLGGTGTDRLGAFWNSAGVAIAGQGALSTTLQRGGQRVDWIGQRLGLRNHVIDEGKRMFQLAAQRNFTTGRKTSHVAAACMYIVCRRDREPYLLLDFSDALHASVRELGQIYMKLVRLLNLDKVLDIPVIDPSLFMERFSARLDLGQKGSQLVSHTASRLIQAMSRHWICTGRRPTGLCGAALLIACKYHGFDRSPSALAEIVRIGEVTIRKRLIELQQTPTAALTLDQFENLQAIEDSTETIDTPTGYVSLPPCLIRNRLKERKMFLKGITNDKVPILPVADVCEDNPTEAHILAVADQVMSSIGGEEGIKSLLEQDSSALLPLGSDGEEEDVEGIAVCDLSHDENDSEDLDEYILTEEESAAKSAIWHEWNKPFLEEWAMREEKKRKELEENGEVVKKRRPASSSNAVPKQPAASAMEATQEVLEKRARLLVKKVDILDSLFSK